MSNIASLNGTPVTVAFAFDPFDPDVVAGRKLDVHLVGEEAFDRLQNSDVGPVPGEGNTAGDPPSQVLAFLPTSVVVTG